MRESLLRWMLPVLLCPGLLWAWGDDSTPARKAARTFILETLRKQEGDTWERIGQFLQWDYRFDKAGCELTVTRDAEVGDHLQQIVPVADATPTGTQGSEIVFACRADKPCIRYRIANHEVLDEQQVSRTRLLVMDPDDLNPLMNAFAELNRLCRDPYGAR